jgi:hypothetical protein
LLERRGKTSEFSTDLACRKSGPLDRQQQPAPNDVAIRTTQSAEKRHYSFGLAQRQVRLQNEPGVPAGGGRLKPLVFLISKLKEEEQGI